MLGVLEPGVSEFAKNQLLNVNKKYSLSQNEAERAQIQEREDYGRQMHRKWRAGDVYAPHDLTGREQAKWKRGKRAQKGDVVDALGINPLLEYKVGTLKRTRAGTIANPA